MDANRVKQILSSPANIRVEYHGVPVWIESCDEGNGIANVHDVANPKESVQVKITELEEQ
ncbi:H-type small acid-soluble spore protein [Ectobacillus panaciterrae]|uniref:H-type small acid-soluble spore protein n=1 Tax=Ectobacillus panaciterrae TaxID=363872 RepID=UPI00041B9594|nr:H-type small acid-soluble spore protein [Ectobacillus panaciterrae]